MKRATAVVLFFIILLGVFGFFRLGGSSVSMDAMSLSNSGPIRSQPAGPGNSDSLDSRNSRRADNGEIVLRLMTYNIHHGEGTDGKLDLGRISALISGSGADIVALQEVDRNLSSRSLWQDQPAKLSQALGMNVEYAAALERFSLNLAGGRGQYGNALLSRYPIVSSERHVMERIDTDEDRAFLHSVIDLGDKKLNVVVTHLGLDPVERQAHMAQIISYMNSLPSPKVLMGDLNAEPGSPELSIASQFLRDAAAMAGNPEQYTFELRNPPVGVPNIRIDFILVSPDITVRETYTPVSPASDHLPVVATISIK